MRFFVAEHAAFTNSTESEPENPVLDDVLLGMGKHDKLHLPGFEEVEKLAVELSKLADKTDDSMAVSYEQRVKILNAESKILDHDRSPKSLCKAYESRWGNTLFGRVGGVESSQKRTAQLLNLKARGGLMGVPITEDTRLQYLVVQLLQYSTDSRLAGSPTSLSCDIKLRYGRIQARLMSDPHLSQKKIYLPNITIKHINAFMEKKKRAQDLLATDLPQVTAKRNSIRDSIIPEAPKMSSPPKPDRDEVSFIHPPLLSGRRPCQKRRAVSQPEPQPGCSQPKQAASGFLPLAPRPLAPCPPPVQQGSMAAPLLLVLPSQPTSSSYSFIGQSVAPYAAPPPSSSTVSFPNKSKKPCSACKSDTCQRKSKQATHLQGKKPRFLYCPTARKSVSPGFMPDHIFKDWKEFTDCVDALQSWKS